LFFSVHVDGIKKHHDKSVCMEGASSAPISGVKAALPRVSPSTSTRPSSMAIRRRHRGIPRHGAGSRRRRLDFARLRLERAPDQQHFLARQKTKELFRKVFALGKGRDWQLMHSGMFLDFLAGNQEAHCTPWACRRATFFGWQKPCYLLGEGYVKTFKELMEDTDWDSYGNRRL